MKKKILTHLKKSLTAKNKLNIGYASAFLTLLGIGVVSSISVTQLVRTNEQIIQTHAAMVELNEVITEIREAESAVRGFHITEKEEFIERFHYLFNLIEKKMAEFEYKFKKNPISSIHFDSIKAILKEKKSWHEKKIQAHKTKGFAAAKELILSKYGESLIDKLEKSVAEINVEANHDILSLTEEGENKFKTTLFIVGIGTLLALSFVSISSAMVKKDMQRRLTTEKEVRLLAHAIMSISEAVSITDKYDNVIFVNDAFLELYGYDEKEIIGKNISILRTGNNPDAMLKEILPKTLKGGWQGEILNKSKDGRVFPISLSTSVMRDEFGEIIALVGVAVNWEEEKKRQALLASSEQKFRTLFESATDAIFILDKTNITECNPVTEKLFGYSKEELLTRKFFDLSAEYQPDGIISEEKSALYLKASLDGSSQFFDWTFHQKDGNILETDVSLSKIEFNGKNQLLAIVRDITAKKIAERALIESEAKYHNVYSNSPLAFVLWDKDCTVIDWNKKAEKIFGWTLEEIKGKNFFEYIIPEYEHERVKELVKIMLSEEVPSFSINNNRTKDGRTIICEWRNTIIHDANGNFKGVVSLALDITERKRAEEIQKSILSISEAVHASNNIEELFDLIHKTLSKLLFTKNFYIALYDPDEEMISFPYFVDEFDDQFNPKPIGKGLTEYILKTGKPLLVTPAVFDELAAMGEVESIGAPSIDWIGVPLKVNDKTIGVMVVQSYDESVRFSTEEKNILVYVSEQVAMAIERKKAQDELKNSEKKFRTLTETMSTGILIYQNSKYIYANPTAERITGYSREELYNMELWELVLPEYREKVKAVVSARQAGDIQQRNYELKITTKHNGIRWLDLTSGTITMDGLPAGIVTVFDITERKHIEETIQKQNNFLNTVIESLTYPFYVIDAQDYKVKHANTVAMKENGYADVTCHKLIFNSDEPCTSERAPCPIQLIKETKKPIIIEQKRYCKNTGDRHFEVHGYPVFDADNNISQIIQYAIDISERKKSEEKINQYIEELQSHKDLLEKKNEELLQLNKKISDSEHELRNANANKDKFFSIISHDLRSPFNSLLGFSEFLMSDLENLSEGEVKASAQNINQASRNLLSFLDKLLEWSKLQMNKIEFTPQDEPLHAITTEVFSVIKGNALKKNISLENKIEEDLWIHADRNTVISVLQNLISNSIKFTQKDGSIFVSAKQQNGEIEVTIEDTGVGISHGDLGRLFNIEIHPSRLGTAKERGTGLGLILSKEFIEKNGGKIWVESKIGVGTKVKFTLPGSKLRKKTISLN